MITRLLNLWDAFRTSYWFVPMLMATGALALSLAGISLDATLSARGIDDAGWLYAGGAEGARALLTTLAGSMITVAGVTFSITIVALTLASSQFGPRLLQNFMRDTGNQVVLGVFLATFLYCLFVLVAINDADGARFVPRASVTIAIAMAVAAIFVLIYFIHHAAASIQADSVIATASAELDGAIDRLFPEATEEGGESAPERTPALPERFEDEAAQIRAAGNGYLKAVDERGLVELAAENDVVLRVETRPGKFVIRESVLCSAWPPDRLNEEQTSRIHAHFILGEQRTTRYDLEFAVEQLVEVAVRALSPGVNDPFTATACIDRLAMTISKLVDREPPSPYRFDGDGKLRLVSLPLTFAGISDAAFHQIRQNGRSSVAVSLRLLEALALIAERARTEEQRAALRRHGELVARASSESVALEADRKEIEERYRAVMEALDTARGGRAAL